MNGTNLTTEDESQSSGKPEIEVINVGIEKKFCDSLCELNEQDPFNLIRHFRDICSTKALQVKDQLVDSPEDPQIEQEFENWQLETKLWHLVEILYSYRLGDIELDKVDSHSSVAIQEENFRKSNKHVAEIGMIIDWIQYNSESVDTLTVPWITKWKHSLTHFETKDLNKLLNHEVPDNYIAEFDIDAPIRLGKRVHPDDEKIDDETFKTIYELILIHNYDEALKIANETGNYTLSMILVGDMLPYLDPVIDKEYIQHRNLKFDGAFGCKHKLLWYQTVYKLSQQRNICKYERMIYSFLSGANINENLNDTKTWDKSLLLYCNQLMVYEIIKFYESIDTNNDKLTSIKVIEPQTTNIEGILNILLRSDNEISEASRHALRIVIGGVMINKVAPLISDIVSRKTNSVYDNQSLIRILVHLGIFLNTVDHDGFNLNQILKVYIEKLKSSELYDVIPIYVSYINEEREAEEIYSNVLLSISDKQVRQQQVKVAKTIIYFNDSHDRLSRVLRRVVEKIVTNTESHYKTTTLTINNDHSEDYDQQLYESVDWFIYNSMYEDIILVSLVIIKRFLLCGKLKALIEFANNKNFKQIINNYDNEVNTRRLLGNGDVYDQIPEESKEELLNHEMFIKGLISINEWKKFIDDNKKQVNVFKTKDVENSLQKTTKQIYSLIMTWLVNSHNEILKDLRNLYVPYLIIELLQIYEFARYNNWEYMQKAFDLMKQVADEDENDLLSCFVNSGRLKDFLTTCGQVSLIASEKGLEGIFI